MEHLNSNIEIHKSTNFAGAILTEASLGFKF